MACIIAVVLMFQAIFGFWGGASPAAPAPGEAEDGQQPGLVASRPDGDRRATKDAPQRAPKLASRDAPRDAPKDAPKRAPKDASKRAPEDAPKRAPKDAPKDAPKHAPKDKGELSLPAPMHDEPVTRFTGDQVLKWKTGPKAAAPSRVSPAIHFGPGRELNHHRLTVDYAGPGTVKVHVASHSSAKLASALKKPPIFRKVASGTESRFTVYNRGGAYAWILIRTTGRVTITGVRHVCWCGQGTIQGHRAGTFTFASAKLPFRLMYPRNYAPGKSYPLVISVSGSGGVGSDNVRSMHVTNLARYLFTYYYFSTPYQCFSLVPQIPSGKNNPAPYWPRGPKGAPSRNHPDFPGVNEHGWYTQATLALIERLLADKRVNIDADRVYFTGYSYGGKACWEFLRAGREVFAAAMCVSGWPIGRVAKVTPRPTRGMLESLDLEVSRHKHIPVYIFTGQRDLMMRAPSRAVYEVLKARGAKVRFTEFPSASHDSVPGAAYRNRKHMTWLFEQNRSKNPPPGKDPAAP